MLAELCTPYILRHSITLKDPRQTHTHGVGHWWQVWETGRTLAQRVQGVDLEVVAMFALFHDAMRHGEGDFDHGERAWYLWDDVEGSLVLAGNQAYRWNPTQSAMLYEALAKHSKGERHTNPTIGVCWDADRLDLHRLGVWPRPEFISTEAGLDLITRRFGKR